MEDGPPNFCGLIKIFEFNISFFHFFFRGKKRISAEEVKNFIDYFRKHAGSKLCVDREGFRKLISTKNSDYYSERIFSLVDQNKDNLVCIDEYTEFMTKLSTDDQNGMIEFLFKIFDTDGRWCALQCTGILRFESKLCKSRVCSKARHIFKELIENVQNVKFEKL